MGMNRKYSGFTLVEMLIVMGIIIILMAVGIAAGRFAINRANDVAHQNAADQLFIAAQSYLTDTREYPVIADLNVAMSESTPCDPETQVCIDEYLSFGEFKGGTDATFYYWTDSGHGSALVCVSLGGINDDTERGYYCTGNGFSHPSEAPGNLIEKKELEPAELPLSDWTLIQDWDNDDNIFKANVAPV